VTEYEKIDAAATMWDGVQAVLAVAQSTVSKYMTPTPRTAFSIEFLGPAVGVDGI
jgi:hypothetical protein